MADYFQLDKRAILPTRGSQLAAGVDLYAIEDKRLHVGERCLIRTGLGIVLPPDHEATVRPRSGLSLKGLDVVLGTIDADYRGEIGVTVVNNTGSPYDILAGQRIAQLVVSKIYNEAPQWVDTIDETERGANGYGSSGL